MMKLYKYKSLVDFEFTAEILMQNILYAAHFSQLNDPMEGDFDRTYSCQEYQEKILQDMDQIRICSLSKKMDNPLMWAHYADGFKGICIELEIDESKLHVREVVYSGFTPIPSEEPFPFTRDKTISSTREWALAALNGKYEDWEYEQEWRIFSQDKYIREGCKVTAVYFGARTSSIYKDIIRQIVPANVPLIDTKISATLVNKVVPE